MAPNPGVPSSPTKVATNNVLADSITTTATRPVSVPVDSITSTAMRSVSVLAALVMRLAAMTGVEASSEITTAAGTEVHGTVPPSVRLDSEVVATRSRVTGMAAASSLIALEGTEAAVGRSISSSYIYIVFQHNFPTYSYTHVRANLLVCYQQEALFRNLSW